MDLFPWNLSLSSILNYGQGFVPPKEQLKITDPSYDLISKWGEPSENWGNMIEGPYYSPLQAWEMWLHRPEPIFAILDPRLSSLIMREPESQKRPQKETNSLLDIIRKFKL